MQKRQSELKPGDLVHARQEAWRVLEIRRFEDCEQLRLGGTEAANAGEERSLLFPFDRPTRQARRLPPRAVRRTAWMRSLAALLSEATPAGCLRAASRAAVNILPFQLEPALAVLRGLASRVLLADEVGLGKTIQAGLILAELAARGEADRTLILTPAGLRDQWARELTGRFSLDVDVTDAATVRALVASLPRGMNPWLLPRIRIVSLDFIKQPDVLRGLEAIIWDVLIVDEAHAIAGIHYRGTAARAIAARSRRVVLVTATPHGGDEAAFQILCETGRLVGQAEPDPIALFRRSRASAGIAARRRSHLLVVRLNDAERRMHDLLDTYARKVWQEASAHGNDGALLAMTVLKKRALSSARALALSVARRLAHLSHPSAGRESQAVLPLDEGEADAPDDRLPDEALGCPGLPSYAHEKAWLGVIEASARLAAQSESKMRRLVRLIARAAEPVIVFTEYRDTLDTVAKAIGRVAAFAVLHGGMPRTERQAVEQAFTTGVVAVLLATDAAGQGLNLQERCRLVINLELPWMPDRLEQRIGRVDRIGQRRTVHAIHLVAADTPEAQILAGLTRRLGRIRAAIGVHQPVLGPSAERQVADAIYAARPLPLVRLSADNARRGSIVRLDLAEDAQREALRLIDLRRYSDTRRGICRLPTRCELTLLDRHRLARRSRVQSEPAIPPGFLCVFRVGLVDAAGQQVEKLLVPVHVAGGVPDVTRPRDVGRLIDARLRPLRDRLADAARMSAAARLVLVQPEHAAQAIRAERRAAMLLVEAGQAIARDLVQPGLFDRRALREAERSSAAASEGCRSIEQRCSRLSSAADVSVADPELLLIAAIPAQRRTTDR